MGKTTLLLVQLQVMVLMMVALGALPMTLSKMMMNLLRLATIVVSL